MKKTNHFAQAMANLRIKEGSPAIQRPSKEEVDLLPKKAKELYESIVENQNKLKSQFSNKIKQLSNQHFLLAGATGPGLGGAIAFALMQYIQKGSITVLARDFSQSLGFATGQYMEKIAKEKGIESQFSWLNSGIASEGPALEKIIQTLNQKKAKKVIYINTVASASSGMLPDHPPVYVKDIDEQGLFQWKLNPLSERAIKTTSLFMGELAVNFPKILLNHGIETEIAVFADWRGSLDKLSRNPENAEYGRQGAYSTSLYLPKDIVQKAVQEAYKTKLNYIDIFYPIMQTRALGFIPGGQAMAKLYQNLMKKTNIHPQTVSKLAIYTLDKIHANLIENNENPFPKLDVEESSLDLWFYEILQKLNNDENNPFYYKKWLT